MSVDLGGTVIINWLFCSFLVMWNNQSDIWDNFVSSFFSILPFRFTHVTAVLSHWTLWVESEKGLSAFILYTYIHLDLFSLSPLDLHNTLSIICTYTWTQHPCTCNICFVSNSRVDKPTKIICFSQIRRLRKSFCSIPVHSHWDIDLWFNSV